MPRCTKRGDSAKSLEDSLGPEGRVGCHGCRCAKLDELFKQVALLREELTRKHSIQESEREIDKWYLKLTLTLTQSEHQPCFNSMQGDGKQACSPE